eukprot:CAMPEP_0113571624 /NCGR_PEP_ID=MMETSP0015_2-20120614/25654_1 /TAXON_ID=2838 /ORGANISM="Odontella" /LENGTH=1020 /DNA_ID=CAMNT_0000474589 /DNA_START=72 /DNA_END=3134 /DNA_ORIENTATION=+ /assembly_acc=CAM_ASM_000160
MGIDQSTPAARKEEHAASAAVAKLFSEDGSGRKSTTQKEVERPSAAPSKSLNLEEEAVLVEEPRLVESEDEDSVVDSDDDESALGDCESEDEEDEEYDEFLLERLRILADSRALRNVAAHFAHPEAPVRSSPERFGRNYFDRAGAPEREDAADAEEAAAALADAVALKRVAADYSRPEVGVAVDDPAATARCFFDRPSAPERLDEDDAEEIARSLSDAARLKETAVRYAHPEKSVSTSDASVLGRNYFSRPSAEPYEEEEVDVDRDDVLEDMAHLKKLAADYLHPEKSVEVDDAAAFGRNYFNRAGAPETEEEEIDAERDEVLEDIAELKKLASDYLRPEKPVEVDPAAFGRNYFHRASAPSTENVAEAEERASALADAAQLKKLAVDFARPEVGVTATDPECFGRDYFGRPSAGEYEEEDVDAERDDVMADAAALKKLAADYARPEKPVATTDSSVFGRNYFNRASAPETEEEEVDAERDEVLEDLAALRKLASDYLRPEAPVDVDPTAFGRNYYGRASAPQEEDIEDAEECAAALADASALKKLAADYHHPEVGVKTLDAAAFGRNYYSRPAAGEYEEEEVDAERDDILEDVAALKKLAVDFAHPEKPVATTDAAAFGRNYFNRASAPGTEEEDIDAERDEVLEDMAALKKLASQFSHPEASIEVDAAVFGRNYFGRASAPQEEGLAEAEERAAALADIKALKQLAVDFAHPEVGVETSDPSTFGRNYFGRPSAGEYEEEDVDAERDDVLADAAALKKLAADYAHPEKPVETADASVFGRNYFNRASAPRPEEDEAEDRAAALAALADAKALFKLAVRYAHPEAPVEVDSAAFGRSYFNRPSAPQEDEGEADERAAVLAEASQFKKLARDYAHPEEGVASTDPAVFGRNYFSRPSAPQQEDETDAEECAAVLAEASSLEKLAKDYAHPEVGVSRTDPAAFGLSYYSRYSSNTHQDNLITAKSTIKPQAAASPLGGEFEHVEAEGRQSTKGKASADDDEGADLPRNTSSHMLFGMAEAH